MKPSRIAAAAALLLLVPSVPAGAYQRPGRLTLVSVTPDGQPGKGPEFYSGRSADGNTDLSAGGRFVAFDSRLYDLVGDADVNAERPDVFVRDLTTGITELISVTPDGVSGAGDSHSPAISADGRFVAFDSDAALVPGDTNGSVDVFVRDRLEGTTERVSVTTSGAQGDGDSINPAISADGRFVAFSSAAENLLPGDENLCSDIFVRDRQTGVTEHVSPAMDGGPSEGICLYVSEVDVSADGRFVAFESQMDDLVSEDRNASWDIFVFDRQSRTMERASVNSDEEEANYVSYAPRISADGRFVAFSSCASNLVPEDNNSSGPKVTGVLGSNTCFDIFVRDRVAGTTERVSTSSTGRETDYASSWVDVSDDGRYVAFGSDASTLTSNAGTYGARTYVHDRMTRQTEVVTVSDDGTVFDGVGFSTRPSLSPEGRFVSFGATSGGKVWVRDRGPAVGVGGMTTSASANYAYASGWAALGGVPIAQATDPANDVAPPEARRLGAELTGAALIYRPEEKDILARFSLASMPTTSPSVAASNYVVPGIGGAPGVLHTLAFSVNGQRWEVRAIRVNVEEAGYPPPPLVGLWKCDPTCRETLHMTASYGTTGPEIIGKFTLKNIAAAAGASITDVSATASLGDALTDDVQVLDQLTMPSGSIPTTELRLALAPVGAEPSAFGPPVSLTNGSFTGSLSRAGLPGGAYALWARTCVGSVCGARSAPITLP